jgi:hypothetical protein
MTLSGKSNSNPRTEVLSQISAAQIVLDLTMKMADPS